MKNIRLRKITMNICISILEIILCLSAANVFLTLFRVNVSNWINNICNLWIILFIKINLGILGRNELQILHVIDFIVFVLCGLIYFILFDLAYRGKNIVWCIFSALALISFPLGILLLAITYSGGRTGILVASLVFSVFTLLNKAMRKRTGILGLVASVTLLSGCDILSLQATNIIVGYIILIGYCCWILWFWYLAKGINRLGDIIL